jgi:dolichyl-phosphate beta-glucosyltransferase
MSGVQALSSKEDMTAIPRDVTLVVPCYNEETRFDADGFRALLRAPSVRLCFVDDGSTDRTRARLEAFAASEGEAVSVTAMPRNVGKAEAVRAGMLRAANDGARVTGFLDADLATPPEEMLRLVRMFDATLDVLLASRVALMGRKIERHAWRHYLGRVFATAASLVIDQPIYDTQCGAKLFRVTPLLEAVLDEPFLSPWIFDVELLGRLLAGVPGLGRLDPARIREEPLGEWRDVAGSKVRASAFTRAPLELTRIAISLRERRKRAR